MRIVHVLAVLLLATSALAEKPPAVTDSVWTEAIVSVSDIERTARFFQEIGGYVVHWEGELSAEELQFLRLPAGSVARSLLLGRPGEATGLVRLVRFESDLRQVPTRPGSRAWDTGCYFSLMVRMKDIASIYDDAIRLGWWTETPITDLVFGTSRLQVVVFQGPDGVQVQGYERLSPPLPDAIPAFERMTRPFNIMQMVRDRDASYRFFTEVLGFDTFYNGKPYLAKQPEFMPLGIPKNLTTSVRYRAGIVYPQAGEFGRMEMIEIMDLDGRDFSDRCNAPNLGILAVRYPVANWEQLTERLRQHGVSSIESAGLSELRPWGRVRVLSIKTPDGANIQFYKPATKH